MKKQFFLLSLLLAAFSGSNVVANDKSCDAKCETSCATDSCSTSNCVPEHGHTFMSLAPEFGAASPERVSLFESSKLKNLKHNEKHGGLQVVLFGGKNTKGSSAAGYYLPYGHTTLNFDGSVKAGTFASVLAESSAQAQTGVLANDELATGGNFVGGGNTSIATDPATFKFDMNKDTSKILPWNFGITYAALFEPRGASANGELEGTGLISTPVFKSKISPCLRRWHIGAGLELAYHFSDEVDGWYGKVSTAVQHVRSRISLNEDEIEPKTKLDASLSLGNPTGTPAGQVDFKAVNANGHGYISTSKATVTPVGSLQEAYLGYVNEGTPLRSTGFPVDVAGDKAASAPATVAEAFNQASWKYGKIGCEQKITRLADIELSIGRLWTCGDCASTTWELGVVIPTGNKPCADYVAPAVVGNNQHAGIRMGSTTSIMLSENDDSSTWFRMDVDSRYLFRNTQKRSFDLKNKEWSRYMMVWESKDAYSSAVTNFMVSTVDENLNVFAPQRGYTPGINVFTTDFYVKPQFQGRLNSAVVMCGERFKAELGWNVHARTRECVELACAWEAKPAFADSSYIAGLGLNNNRTIFNDSQTTVVNGVDSLTRGWTMANQPLVAVTAAVGTVTPASTQDANVAAFVAQYDNFAITDADINYDSVSTPGSISHTPYLTLGYAFDYDWAPVVAVGASYEFTANNRSLNQWMVWGKFECAF